MPISIRTIYDYSTEIIPEQSNRKQCSIVNYSDRTIWLGINEDATVNAAVSIAPNGGEYVISREAGTFTIRSVSAINDNIGPTQIGLTADTWNVNETPPLRALSDVTIFDLQPGDAPIYDPEQFKFNNGPILFSLDFLLEGSPTAQGFFKEPIELQSDGRLLSVRLHTNNNVGSIEFDILSAAFGGDFSSIIGTGTYPTIADASSNQWYQNDDLGDWDVTLFDVGTWFWINVLNADLTSVIVSLMFQRAAQAVP